MEKVLNKEKKKLERKNKKEKNTTVIEGKQARQNTVISQKLKKRKYDEAVTIEQNAESTRLQEKHIEQHNTTIYIEEEIDFYSKIDMVAFNRQIQKHYEDLGFTKEDLESIETTTRFKSFQ
jgi:hypothetical protein